MQKYQTIILFNVTFFIQNNYEGMQITIHDFFFKQDLFNV